MECMHALEEGPAEQALTPAPVPAFRVFTATLLLPDFTVIENTAQTGNTEVTDVITPSSLLVQTVLQFSMFDRSMAPADTLLRRHVVF